MCRNSCYDILGKHCWMGGLAPGIPLGWVIGPLLAIEIAFLARLPVWKPVRKPYHFCGVRHLQCPRSLPHVGS